MINIPMYFKKYPAIGFPKQHRRINNAALLPQCHLLEQGLNVVRMQADAAMALKVVDAGRSDGAVYANRRNAQAQPMFAKRIVRSRWYLRLHQLTFAHHFFLNGFWHSPGLVDYLFNHNKVAFRAFASSAGLSPPGMRLAILR